MMRRSDRRAFVSGGVSLGVLGLLGCKLPGSDLSASKDAVDTVAGGYPAVRKSITSAAAEDDLRLYRKAVALLKESKVWTAQATIHYNFCTHGNWFFLPWHRFYLMYFEEVCRHALRSAGESDAFSLPYWSWPDTDRRIPSLAWGDGNPLFDNTRSMGASDTFADAACGAGTLTGILQIKNFIDFGGGRASAQHAWGGSGHLESMPHNTVHSAVGGDMGHFMSPLDPLFWLHHANVDRLWAQWQAQHPDIIPSNPNAQDGDGKDANGLVLDAKFWLDYVLDGYEDLQGVRFTQVVKDCLDTTKMLKPYTYDVLVTAAGTPVTTVPPAAKVPPNLALRGPLSGGTHAAPVDRIFVQSKDAGLIIKIDQASKIISANIQFSPELQTYLARLSSSPNFTGSFTLIVEHIPVPTDELAHRISLDFYANHPELTPETDASDVHFLSCYSFFVHQHPGAQSEVSLRISLNQPLLKMRAAGSEVRTAMLLQVLVKDRLLQALPNLDFFSSIRFRLQYTES
ncbi:MAG: tyrosinase family protein [Proteobacteria bacterium]|nr:tyrosinase family protein [Pseudomonadota bacterium]